MFHTDNANAFVDQVKPWDLAKQIGKESALHQSCSEAINIFRLLTIYLKPILPRLAAQVEMLLNIKPLQWSDAKTWLPDGHTINEYKHLMTRVDPKQMTALVEANRESLKPAAPAPQSQQRHAQHQENVVEAATQPATISIDDFTKSICASRKSSTPSTSKARTSC